jgi:uncharacterized protein YdaU (DUF1376 family)
MAALPYMQFHIAEYLADTSHLTTEEHGAYLLLIFNYWQRGKPLDNSNGRLANVVRMSNERWTDVSTSVREFFQVEGDVWTHARIERDLKRVNGKCEQARDARSQRKSYGRSTDVATDVQRVLKEESIKREEESKAPEDIFFDANMVATAVMTECRLTGMPLKMALEQLARYEIADGKEGLSLVVPLCEAWRAFSEAKPRLSYVWGAEKFFGEGNWKNQAGWPWRENGSNQQNQAARVSPAVQRQRESDQALRNIVERRYGVRVAPEADEGSVHQPGNSGGHAGDVPGRVGGYGSEVRPESVSGWIIEGNPR